MIILVSVICYKNEDEIVEFAKMLSRQSISQNVRLLVTCNSCDDYLNLTERLREVSNSVEVYKPPKNLGYIHGGLYGIISSNIKHFDWAVISNTDIVFSENDFLEKLIKSGEGNDDIWALAPNTYRNSNGVRQNPFLLNRPSCHKMWLWKSIYSTTLSFSLYFILSRIKRKIVKEEVELIGSGYIYAEDGSFFMICGECVDALVRNSDNLFMYGEEILIAEIINEYQKKIYYNQDAVMIHNENATTSLVKNRKKQKWFKQSYQYLYNRFFKE